MKFVAVAVLCATALCVGTVDARDYQEALSETVGKENEEYWARFLQGAEMSAPTPPPTPPPPQPLDCDVEVTVDCTITGSSEACDTITQPSDDICSGAECIELLKLSYNEFICDESMNSQGTSFECEDGPGGMIPPGEAALIFCTDTVRVFCNCSVVAGGIIELAGEDGGCLPDEMTCTISNAETGIITQTVTFDTSGDVSLSLKDRFGKLTVEGCDDGDEEKNCLVDVDYLYTVSNDGDFDAFITTFDRVCNGETLDLIEGLPPTDPFRTVPAGAPGLVVREPATVDACAAECQEKEVTLVTEVDGTICEDTDELEYCIPTQPPTTPPPTPTTPPPTPTTPPPTPTPETPPPTPPPGPGMCTDVVSSITCTTSVPEGEQSEPCEAITPPDGSCTGGVCVERLTLQYNDCTCDESMNSQGTSFVCEDIPCDGIPSGAPALVTCINAERVFCNCTVTEGNTITIRGEGGGCLPENMTCTIQDAQEGGVCQELTFVTNGDVPLELEDKFGKLTVKGCDNGEDELDCLVNVDYTYTVENTGPVEAEITSMIREIDGEPRNLIENAPGGALILQPDTGLLSVGEGNRIDACGEPCREIELFVEVEVADADEACEANSELEVCTGGGRKLSDSQPALQQGK